MHYPELQYRIALTMIPAIGPVTARDLIGAFGSAGAIFREPANSLYAIKRIGPLLAHHTRSGEVMEKAGRELEFLSKHRIKAHYFDDPDYPHRLNQCKDGPMLLYSRGNQCLNPERSLSVVGTRRASSYGKEVCRELINGLQAIMPGLVIVSGLAYGIDVIAHRAALNSGLPTFAVLGHGLSTIYPASHRETATKILRQGALITDFDSGTGPERNNFLRRNRIIAGLSDATLVVESAEKGGALTTAQMALSYSRDVLAVPGRSCDSRSKGCNNLIKYNMAALTVTVEDILRHLNWAVPDQPEKQAPPDAEISHGEKELLLSMEEFPGITPDALSNRTGIPVNQVLAMLLEMELKDWISAEPGNRYSAMISIG